MTYDNCLHGLSGSHLLRELQFVVDSNHYAWAKNMKRLLQQTCAKVSRRKRTKLTEKEYLPCKSSIGISLPAHKRNCR
ncbi:MAG: hypothetical protein P8Y45_06425, partial [Exilibacterium sp.]